jgi:hypothetical protein
LVELGANCVDSAQLEVQLTMHRKVFGALPSLHGANVAVQVGGNLLPPAQGLPLLGCRARSREVKVSNQGRGGGHDRLYDKERHGLCRRTSLVRAKLYS